MLAFDVIYEKICGLWSDGWRNTRSNTQASRTLKNDSQDTKSKCSGREFE